MEIKLLSKTLNYYSRCIKDDFEQIFDCCEEIGFKYLFKNKQYLPFYFFSSCILQTFDFEKFSNLQ